LALVFDGFDYSERPRRAGAAGAAMILGVGTGAPVGGILTQALGPRAPLAGAGLLFLFLAVAALLLAEPAARRARIAFAEIGRALAARPRLLLPAGLYFVERFTVGLFVVVFPVYLAETAGAEPAARGRYLAMFLFPFALGQLGTYRLTRRFGALAPLALGAAAYGLAFGVLAEVPVEMLGGWMALLGLLAAVIFPPTLALTAEWSSPATRASAIAGFNVAGSLGFALGPVVGARAAAAGGYAGAFELGGTVAVAGAVVATVAGLLVRRRLARGTA
jgi:MFS family permease